jgi:hypothetical protein
MLNKLITIDKGSSPATPSKLIIIDMGSSPTTPSKLLRFLET